MRLSRGGDRLLAATLDAHETWESMDPVLVCYHHAVELHLEALVVTLARQTHALQDLIATPAQAARQFRQAEEIYFCDRLSKFGRQDSSSTAFRCTDAVALSPPAELWDDLHHLSATLTALFSALEWLWLAPGRLDDWP